MSEDPQPQEVTPTSSTPAVATPAPAPGSTPAQPGGATPATPTTPSTTPIVPKPPVPTPIDYAILAPKQPFTLSRSTFLSIRMFFGLILALCLGYFALVALNPKARQWATQGTRDGSGGPTPFKFLNQILAIPAQAAGKSKEVGTVNDARDGVPHNVIADETKSDRQSRPPAGVFSKPAAGAPGKPTTAGQDPAEQNVAREPLLAPAEKNAAPLDEPAKPAVTRAHANAPTPPPGPSEMKLGGGITITNIPAPDATPASARFMYWVASLGVSGVSNTTPARFLMNGRLVSEGEEVNKALTITFDRLDAPAKLIYFRDKSGASVSRSY